jgi:hypothetical protein
MPQDAAPQPGTSVVEVTASTGGPLTATAIRQIALDDSDDLIYLTVAVGTEPAHPRGAAVTDLGQGCVDYSVDNAGLELGLGLTLAGATALRLALATALFSTPAVTA